jgi:hypothetical protein
MNEGIGPERGNGESGGVTPSPPVFCLQERKQSGPSYFPEFKGPQAIENKGASLGMRADGMVNKNLPSGRAIFASQRTGWLRKTETILTAALDGNQARSIDCRRRNLLLVLKGHDEELFMSFWPVVV